MGNGQLFSLFLFLLFVQPFTTNADCGDNICDCQINIGITSFKLCDKIPGLASINTALKTMRDQTAAAGQKLASIGNEIVQKKNEVTNVFKSGGDLVTETSPRSFFSSVQKASETLNNIGQRAPAFVGSLAKSGSQLPQLIRPEVVEKFTPASRLVADYFSGWFIKQLTDLKQTLKNSCFGQSLDNGTIYFGVSSQLVSSEISFSLNFAGIQPLICLVQSQKQILNNLKTTFDNTQPWVVAQKVMIKASQDFVSAVSAVVNMADIAAFCKESNNTGIDLPSAPEASAPEWMKALYSGLSRVSTILGPSGYIGKFYYNVKTQICSAKSPEALVTFAKNLDGSISQVNSVDVASAIVDGFFNAAQRTANGFQSYLTDPNSALSLTGTPACLIQHLKSEALWINLKLSISAHLLPPFVGVQHSFGVSCHKNTIQCLSCVFKNADSSFDFILNKINQFNTSNIFQKVMSA